MYTGPRQRRQCVRLVNSRVSKPPGRGVKVSNGSRCWLVYLLLILSVSVICEYRRRAALDNGHGQHHLLYCVLRTENIFVCWCCVGSDHVAGVGVSLGTLGLVRVDGRMLVIFTRRNNSKDFRCFLVSSQRNKIQARLPRFLSCRSQGGLLGRPPDTYCLSPAGNVMAAQDKVGGTHHTPATFITQSVRVTRHTSSQRPRLHPTPMPPFRGCRADDNLAAASSAGRLASWPKRRVFTKLVEW